MQNPDESDLEVFRTQWQAELKSRPETSAASAPSQLNISKPTIDSRQSALWHQKWSKDGVENKENRARPLLAELVKRACSPPPMIRNKGILLYEEAMVHEHNGRLSDALKGYRSAFKLDPNVDMNYQRHMAALSDEVESMSIKKPADIQVTQHYHQHKLQQAHEESHDLIYQQHTSSPSPILKHLAIDTSQAFLRPKRLDRPFLINVLPDDILLQVLQLLLCMDIAELTHVALICKKLYSLTRVQIVWRFLCEHHYPRAHICEHEVQYRGNWTQFFIEQPRLRIDGVYISRYMYIRPGISDTSYYAPIHLIEYYRYLRFYSDGVVISLLTTAQPREIVKAFSKNSLNKTKGFMTGQYTLNENQLHTVIFDKLRPNDQFDVRLTLQSTSKGLHNKLTWREYSMETRKLNEVNVVKFDLINFKPFYFSKVRSYVSSMH